MLSAIVKKVTGETVVDYLRPRLFEPLGIENPEWGSSPQGVTLGGWGLKIRTEDIAKFGHLYLQKGRWNGKQIVPAAWVELATGRQVSNGSNPNSDWEQGYGFQFWRCRHGAFRGDGANGQFCIVLPDEDAVIAITADTRDMQAQLNVVWEKLLPAFVARELPVNKQEQLKLAEALGNLSVRPAAPAAK
jgi:CubicO group peptidase (beta-lactamase class C family)